MSSSSGDIYEQCAAEVSGNSTGSTQDLIKCTVRLLQTQTSIEDPTELASQFLLVYSAALVFFMQSGFAMICAGCVRLKNVKNTMLKNLLDACGAALGYYAIGYAFSYGSTDDSEKTFIGNTNFFLMNVEDLGFWLFQYAFSAASVTIVAGTLAERCQMIAYFSYSIILAGFVYPVVAHFVWSQNGYLSPSAQDPFLGTGMIDFAGGGVVHATGGLTALCATIILGPRRGRFHDNQGRPLKKPNDLPGHSIALQMLGTFILWFGWYGFNVGSALKLGTQFKGKVGALAAVNTTLSGGVAGIVSLATNYIIEERRTGEPILDPKYAMNGALSGLVAITAGCGIVEPWAALIIGIMAGLFYVGGSALLVKCRLDDAVDAIPVHFINGMWGVFAVGLLAAPTRLEDAYANSKHAGIFYYWVNGSSDATLLAAQVVGMLFIIGWVLLIMFPFFIWLNWKGWFRADALEELVGLDRSYHGGLVLRSEEVNPEYVDSFNQPRENRAHNRENGLTLSRDASHDPHESEDNSNHSSENASVDSP